MAGPWITPHTWEPAELVDDVQLNEELRNQLLALKNDHRLCDGRLTVISGTPLPLVDGDAAGNITYYFTPYRGNRIGLYATGPDSNANWHVLSFSELSNTISGFSMPDGNYDIFAFANTTLWTVGLEATGWVSDTTRAVALSTLDGVRVKSSDPTRRYLGSLRVSSGRTWDTALRRWVFNDQHRVPRPLRVVEATASWTGQTGSPEYVRASSNNQVSVFSGTGDALISLVARLTASNTTPQVTLATQIGENSAVAPAAESLYGAAHTPVANYNIQLAASLVKYPAAGYNAYAWLQYSQAAGTTTWLGASTNILQSGMAGFFEA